jgi:type I restriction enzyme S subunit
VNCGQLDGYTEYDISDAPSRARRIIRNNDIIYSTVRPNLRAYYYVKDCPDNAICSTGFAVLRAKDNVDSRFVYSLVTENSFVDYLSLVAKGSAYPAADTADFKKAKVTVPDLPTQNRIADILSGYDDLIENNNRRIALLEKAAQELYKEWFVRFRFPGHETAKFENGLPEGWKVEKLGKLCKIITGKKDANEATGQGVYPFFTCARETTTFTDEYILDTDAILISGNGSYTGLVKKYSGKFDLYQRTYALFDFENIEWLYAYWNLKINFEREFMGGSRGSAIPYITRPNIEKFKVVVPTKELMVKAQEIFEAIHNECSSLERKNKNLTKQRDLLLPRLMSGKLEV